MRAFWVCRFALWGAAVLALAACASLLRDPVTPELESQVSVLESVQVRYWGDRAPDDMAGLAAEKWAQVKSPRPLLTKAGGRPQISLLAVSGGGSDGAFGAGLLVGWTARGDWPEFDSVTGVSTGALTALSSNAPLAGVIAKFVDAGFLNEVAREHARGRRLLIGTTNLDIASAGSIHAKLGINPARHLYILRNGRLDPEYKAVKASTLAIAGRSISTLVKTQGIGDLYQMYEFARRNRIDYNLAFIPGNFPDTSMEAFDPKYMPALFDLGFELGKSGHPWKKTPPRLGNPS